LVENILKGITMNVPTTTRLIKIGNSQGIRIPKTLIDLIGLKGEVEIQVQPGQIVLRPTKAPRKGWDEQFRAMAAAGDDALMDDGQLPATDWDAEEWAW
jgi:antitoxin MazE